MANRYVAKPAVFVLEIEQRPVVAFEVVSAREARELAKERWLQDDLAPNRWAIGEQVDEVRSAIRSALAEDELAIGIRAA